MFTSTTADPGRPHRRRGLRAALAGLASLALVVPAAPALATGVPGKAHRTGIDRELQRELDALVAAGATGVTALVDDGTTVRTASSGVARLDTGEPMTPRHATRVGSITKTFVATVLLQLVGEHRLDLDDSVESHLPGRVPDGEEITVRQLLNHTSGIYNYTDDEEWLARALTEIDHVWTPDELVDVAVAHEPVFAPGTSWSYSNTNYILLGMVIERVTGERIEDLIGHRIIRPLRLRSTFLAGGDHVPSWQAHGYIPPSMADQEGYPPPTDGGYIDTTSWPPDWAWAAGALVSTTADLSRFYRALLSGRLLEPAQLAELTATVPLGEGFGYGLGLLVQETPCGTLWGHDGGIPGYISTAFTDREGRRSGVLLLATDLDEAMLPSYVRAVATLACHMVGQEPTPEMLQVPSPDAAEPTEPTAEEPVTEEPAPETPAVVEPAVEPAEVSAASGASVPVAPTRTRILHDVDRLFGVR
jgi:D-alanyl-D-alanine carboxypeptidase